jgi:hypothetical protein
MADQVGRYDRVVPGKQGHDTCPGLGTAGDPVQQEQGGSRAGTPEEKVVTVDLDALQIRTLRVDLPKDRRCTIGIGGSIAAEGGGTVHSITH